MKTIKSTGPLFYGAKTDKTPGVPKGKVHVHMVRYETLEMDAADFDVTTFKVHDANQPEPIAIAKLVDL